MVVSILVLFEILSYGAFGLSFRIFGNFSQFTFLLAISEEEVTGKMEIVRRIGL